jgi:hypothetical protein
MQSGTDADGVVPVKTEGYGQGVVRAAFGVGIAIGIGIDGATH